MPELPDVEAYRRTLRDHALGKRIRAVQALDPAVLRNSGLRAASSKLVRHSFVASERHGKWVIARLTGHELLFHFGMKSRLEWLDPDDELGRFVRLRLEYADGALVLSRPTTAKWGVALRER
jgi:formamidopyrimidine-DNA glycosylase